MLKGSIHINTAGHNQKGSALILVIVLTVLLAAVGVLFLMTARIDEMSTSGIVRTRELSAGVNVVVDRIRTVLTDDLFGGDGLLLNGRDDPCAPDEDEYWDYPGDDDPWLASLEPVYDSGNAEYEWSHITDLYGHISAISGFEEVDDPTYPVSSGAVTRIIPENEPVGYVVDPGNTNDIRPWGTRADADGDGVADSRWIALPDITSSGGENIYAAVRIIDNCGMININTAYRDPTSLGVQTGDWDGSLLAHVNLEGIISTTDSTNGLDAAAVQAFRYGNIPLLLSNYYDYQYDVQYENDVSRRLLNPVSGYLPFDIGDELELRNRYFLSTSFNYPGVIPRCSLAWPVTFNPQAHPGRRIPFGSGDSEIVWFDHVKPDIDEGGSGIGAYNRRLLSTTYSFDRIIIPWTDTSGMPTDMQTAWDNWTNWDDPDPDTWSYRPVSINDPDPALLAAAIWLGLSDVAAIPTRFGQDYDREKIAWQFALNLIDYQDDDGIAGDPMDEIPEHILVSVSDGAGGSNDVAFYGVEHIESIKRKTLCISEVGYRDENSGPVPATGKYYVVEIYNPAVSGRVLSDYELWIGVPPTVTKITLSGTINANDVAVVSNQADPCDISDAFGFGTFDATNYNHDISLSFSDDTQVMIVNKSWIPSKNIPVDYINIPSGVVGVGLPLDTPRLKERNEEIGTGTRLLTVVPPTPWPAGTPTPGSPLTLGVAPIITPGEDLQLGTNNKDLAGVGEIEKVFAAGYYYNVDTGQCSTLVKSITRAMELLGLTDPEPGIPASNMKSYGRIRLADPNFHGLLNYLTYFEPFNDGLDNDGDLSTDEDDELQIAGRININTAPWFVIKQLPWLGLENDAITDSDDLARAITAWRDMLDLSSDSGPDYSAGRAAATGISADLISEDPGFRNIGELMQVINTSGPLPDDFDIRKYLDGNPLVAAPDFSADIVTDDFEERNILFHRVSNLVTVRSDVFTAYILVRIGQNGPQKRMIAIFDRSGVFSPTDKPKLVALHQVPDPR